MDIPDFREEVQRKFYEAITKVVRDRDTGKITNAQFSYGLDVLWAACSGLGNKDFAELITAAGEEVVQDSSYFKTTFLINYDKMAIARVVNMIPHQKVQIQINDLRSRTSRAKVYNLSDSTQPSTDARMKEFELIDHLILQGYQEQ